MGRTKKFNKVEINGKVSYIFYNTLKEKDAGFFVVDTKNLNKIKNYNGINLRWYKNDAGYAIADISKTKHIRMHRVIMSVVEKTVEEVEIDHINGYRDDNRECNLRPCFTDEEKTAHHKNETNRQKTFLFPDVVEIKRDTKIHLFSLKVSNGIFKNVFLYFEEFDHLLKVRDFLYDVGLDKGIPQFLLSQREYILKQMQSFDNNSIEYITHQKRINYIESKLKEAKENLNFNKANEKLQELKAKGIEIPKDTPFVTDDGQILIISTMTSKEKIERIKSGEDIPIMKFLGNYQED